MTYSDSDAASSVGSIVEDASEPDTTTFKCLFCDQQWSRVTDMSTHCKKDHSFDLADSIKQLGPSSSTISCALPI
jgi:protein arginine N-methyltransferase 3